MASQAAESFEANLDDELECRRTLVPPLDAPLYLAQRKKPVESVPGIGLAQVVANLRWHPGISRAEIEHRLRLPRAKVRLALALLQEQEALLFEPEVDESATPAPPPPSERRWDMAIRAEQINQVIRDLVHNTPDVEGAAVVSVDGLILTSVLPAGTDEDRVAAMAAALLALGQRSTEELQRGIPEQVYVKGSQGYLVIVQAGPEAVLEVIAGANAKLGMLFLDMKRAAQEVAKLI